MFNWSAHVRPAGPDPTIAIFLLNLLLIICGFTYPFKNAFSIICFSIFSMVTGSWLIPKTQECSQGAGQILPVNSGKSFWEALEHYR